MKTLEEFSVEYMEKFRADPQNNHLHPWVAAKIGFEAGCRTNLTELNNKIFGGDVVLNAKEAKELLKEGVENN